MIGTFKHFLFPRLTLPFVGWAIAGAAVVGAVASNSAANKQKAAADNATNAQREANDRQYELAQQQQGIATDQYNRYKTTFAPMEERMAAEAQESDSPMMYARAAGEAQGATMDQYELARQRLARTPGLDQSSAAYTTGLTNMGLSAAATSAQQQNNARTQVRDKAWARKVDALSLGKGMAANASSSLSNAASGMSSVASSYANTAQQQNALRQQSSAQFTGTMSGLGGMARDAYAPYAAQGVSPMQAVNRQFTTTNAPWSESASVLGPDGAMN